MTANQRREFMKILLCDWLNPKVRRNGRLHRLSHKFGIFTRFQPCCSHRYLQKKHLDPLKFEPAQEASHKFGRPGRSKRWLPELDLSHASTAQPLHPSARRLLRLRPGRPRKILRRNREETCLPPTHRCQNSKVVQVRSEMGLNNFIHDS